MSTGLTYVFIGDMDDEANPIGSASFIFSAYNEAYEYGSYLVSLFPNLAMSVVIWTTSPNDNGYWIKNAGEPVFTISE